jgi:hypothetical protein
MRSRHLSALIASAVIAALVASTAAFATHDGAARSGYLYFHVKSPVVTGQLAHVVVQGRTGLCRITVSKGGAQMRPKWGGLSPLTSANPLAPVPSIQVDDNRVAWQWTVPIKTPPGQWQVRVNCGRAATLQGTLLVED